MNLAGEQDTRLTLRNLLHFFTLTMKYQKLKVKKKNNTKHFLKWHPKRKVLGFVRYNLIIVANTVVPYIRKLREYMLRVLFSSFYLYEKMGFPGGTSGKEPTCQCRRCKRCGFDPWVRKISWRTQQPTPVFLSGEYHGQRSLPGSSP